MTRRIAIAILLTVWTMLVAGGCVAYWTTRSILLADLDASLLAKAMSLPALVHPDGTSMATARDPADRWRVTDEVGRTLDRPEPGSLQTREPEVFARHFSRDPDGRLLRTLSIRALALPANKTGPMRPVTVNYSGYADAFNAMLNRLAATLVGFGVVAGLITAAVAIRVSSLALRPLERTADQVRAIDERNLDQRIDVTTLPAELLPIATRLNEMLARLQEAFHLRNQFLADASHELRTPVAALVTTLEVALLQPRDADAYRRTLESCSSDAGNLRRLVERLMEQVRSQSLIHDEPARPVDVAALLSRCIDNVTPLAEVNRISIVRSFTGPMPCLVRPGRLQSIVMNLLSNAVEYNRPDGLIELRASCNGDGFKLAVRDTGVGVAAEHLPHLFEPFYRVDDARRHEAGHLGLGLSLVQSHVRAMRGTCAAESQPGLGTTFYVNLPEVTEASVPSCGTPQEGQGGG